MNVEENNTNIKLEHERFVTGHNGSNVFDISLVASSAPVAIFCLKLAILIYGWSVERFYKKFFFEFVILVGFPLLSLTLLADCALESLLVVLSVCLTTTFWQICDQRSNCVEIIGDEDYDEKKNFKQILSSRPSFLGNYRAYVNVATAICILAVDFEIFPRRFCKTETFGTGLMDVGVGSFVVANAVVSKEARGRYERISFRRFVRTVLSTWPLLMLGVGRFVSIKSLDYHEHATEYGVHWNFFFTLAVVKIVSAFIYFVVSPKHSLVASFVMCGAYEVLLGRGGLSEYLLAEGNRSHPVHANREGLFSCLGYLALYLASVRLGMFLFSRRKSHGSSEPLRMFAKMLLLDVLLWLLLYYCQHHGIPVSRRMANFSYVVWMMAYNILMLSMFLLVEIAVSYFKGALEKDETNSNSFLLEAINSNGLLFFLLSNLLTGLINMTYNTLLIDHVAAILILFLYMFCLCTVIGLLRYCNILVKFW